MLSLDLGLQAPAPLQQADEGQRSEDCRVRVGESDDREAGGLERRPQVAAVIAPDFVAEHRVIAAQERHRCDVDDGVAARFEQAVHFSDCGALVRGLEGIQHVEGRDEIERRARERHRRDAGPREMPASGFAADAQADLGQVEAERAAEGAEQIDVRAGAAAAVEQQRIAAAGDGACDKRRDEGAESAEPEMSRFRLRGGAQQMFHAAIVAW
jgi:hypothetical protein